MMRHHLLLPLARRTLNDVVDAKDHFGGLRRGHKDVLLQLEGLTNAQLRHVTNASLIHINACANVAIGVGGAQVGDNLGTIITTVLRNRGW